MLLIVVVALVGLMCYITHMSIPRNEQQTSVAWLKEEKLAYLYTSDPTMANRWRKRGYDVAATGTVKGVDSSWSAKVESRLIRFGPVSVRKSHNRTPTWLRKAPSTPTTALTNVVPEPI